MLFCNEYAMNSNEYVPIMQNEWKGNGYHKN